jgi:hypothetical protein
MAVATVVNQIQAYYEAVTGIGSTHVRQGRPAELAAPGELDIEQYPLVILTAPIGFRYERRGMGTSGKGFIRYDAVATIYLGPPDMAQDDAIALAVVLVDRIRLRFEGDHTLGAVCFNAETGDPADNLLDFRERNEPPALQFTHRVQEERTPAQAAA